MIGSIRQRIVTLSIIAAITFTFFIIWELTDKNPIVDLTLFKVRNFTIGSLSIMLGYGVFFGNVVLIPMWLQRFMGYTATWSGLATASVGIFAMILSPIVGQVMRRVDLRLIATLSFLVFSACGFWRSTFSPDVDFGTISMTHMLQGIAMATFFIPLNALIISSLAPSRIPAASGLYNFMRIMAGSFAASVWTTTWENRATYHHAVLVGNITPSSIATTETLQSMQALGFDKMQVWGLIETEINRQAFIMSALDLFWLSGILFLGLIALVWQARPIR